MFVKSVQTLGELSLFKVQMVTLCPFLARRQAETKTPGAGP